MQYQLYTGSPGIKKIDDDGTISFVPNDSANADWRQYQAWLAADPENNVPLEEGE